MNRRLLFPTAVVVLAIAACSFFELSLSGPAPDPSPSPQSAEEGSPTAATDTSSLEHPSAGSQLGLPGIELLTPSSGGGTRPILEWTEVNGADHYLVSVKTAEGNGYWAWRTDTTSVPVGGPPRLNEEAVGPRIVTGMTWSVIALDRSDAIIAASNNRPIAP